MPLSKRNTVSTRANFTPVSTCLIVSILTPEQNANCSCVISCLSRRVFKIAPCRCFNDKVIHPYVITIYLQLLSFPVYLIHSLWCMHLRALHRNAKARGVLPQSTHDIPHRFHDLLGLSVSVFSATLRHEQEKRIFPPMGIY